MFFRNYFLNKKEAAMKYFSFFFQNASLTWYTADPEFTKCFEKTILVWLPCLFLWVFSPIEVYYLLNSRRENIPWNWLNISKLGLTCLVIVVIVGELFFVITAVFSGIEVRDVDFLTPLTKGLTIVSINLH